MKRPQDGEPYGPLTLQRHREFVQAGVHLHVFVNGVDVTGRCEYADDSPGKNRAVLFKVDAQGHKFTEVIDGESTIAMEVITSGVEIREGAPFA